MTDHTSDQEEAEFEKVIAWYRNRQLQTTTNQTVTATASADDDNPFGTGSPSGSMPFNDQVMEPEKKRGWGPLFKFAILGAFFYVGYRSFKRWQMMRHHHRLQEQSSRADAVLGDMQMIPDNEYDDDDPELL